MRRMTDSGIVVAVTFALATVIACSREPGADQVPAQGTEITFTSDPVTPKMGDNTFEVMVMKEGQPVDDAQVSVEFLMPAMPEMKMAEMRTTANLKPAGNGTYHGTGQVMMAGKWDVTVMAMRSGQEIAQKKLVVAAR
jgi:nitrogen fixation protein FixH